MKVGREIRRLRQERGLSQTQLAAAADLSVSALSMIETGVRNPSAVTLEKIADALDVTVGDLFPKGQSPLPFDEPERARIDSAAERLQDDEAALAILFRGLARRARLIVERSRREGPSVELGEDSAALHAEAAALYRLRGSRDIRGTGSEELATAVDTYEEVEGTIQAMLRQDVEASDEARDTVRRFRPDAKSKHRKADAS